MAGSGIVNTVRVSFDKKLTKSATFEPKLAAGAIASVAAFTGTATRTTRVTSSVTLPQLAEAFKALTDDLRTRGIIS